MMHHIVEVVPQDDYILKLRFRDGSVRLLDMKPTIREGGVFGILLDKTKFREVKAQPDGGELEWANGADFCPNTAYMESKPYTGED